MGYAAYDAGRVTEMHRRMVEVVDEATRLDSRRAALSRCGRALVCAEGFAVRVSDF